VADDPLKAMLEAAEARKTGLTPAQAEARRLNDLRAKAIQATPLKAKDGVTFGKKASVNRP
jgi:hypothetical protein